MCDSTFTTNRLSCSGTSLAHVPRPHLLDGEDVLAAEGDDAVARPHVAVAAAQTALHFERREALVLMHLQRLAHRLA